MGRIDSGLLLATVASVSLGVKALPAAAQVTLYPVKDGTVVDDGVDGTPDRADWSFNSSSYEGAITLMTLGSNPQENRVVWEYSLGLVTLDPPVSATLTYTIRGAPIFPLPEVDVFVYAYASDLEETLSDFSAGPAALVGWQTLQPYQEPTVFSIDVSGVINEALGDDSDRAAFRFQVDPSTPNEANQAFIDALDSERTTKPALTIRAASSSLASDYDVDGDIDIDDVVKLVGCMSGPEATAGPGCSTFDFDADANIDLLDVGDFQVQFGSAF